MTILKKITLFSLVFFVACTQQEEICLFQKIDSKKSGVDFVNQITETDSFNILNFHYIYNGGGVGAGDFNNDGWTDLIFTGNQVESKIYLNQQDLHFKDITTTSGLVTKGWITGVSVVDINQDGWLDIYLSTGGTDCKNDCFNQLFVNQGVDENGIPVFKEMATDYGLEDGQYTQQAAFFDYDADGDLDAYLLHNLTDTRDKNAPAPKKYLDKLLADRLLENTGDGKFVDVSAEMGIIEKGYGLGIAINDFNQDQLPDIYIANDFLTDDVLYLNQGFDEKGQHKGFLNHAKELLKHTSYNAMGVDVADVNNDGLPEIFTLDMMPEYHERQKTMIGFMNYDKFLMLLRQGYNAQFIRNTLQVHNGMMDGKILPFSETAYFSGIEATDWSWAPLLADFDNDGDRDLFVTNGYGKDITDLDFINFSNNRNPFGTKESQEKAIYEEFQKMTSVKMPNYIFENTGGLKFEKQNNHWLKNENSISNGAIHVDLDNDGDLDLVVNNINDPAFILENQLTKDTTKNYLAVKLAGQLKKNSGVGATIDVWTNGTAQTHFESTTRGYLSAVQAPIHFGVNEATMIDSIVVKTIHKTDENPTTYQQTWHQVPANQTITLDYQPQIFNQKRSTANELAVFQKDTETNIPFTHQDNIYQDFNAQHLLLHQHSRQAPVMIAANLDGKTGDEVFIGGSKGTPSKIYFQKMDGTYTVQTFTDIDSEVTAAHFFDADNDKDLDLYVVNGGSEFSEGHASLKDQLYLNDGNGQFILDEQNDLPLFSGGTIIAEDIDQDGDLDLFVGGRISPRHYPKSPESCILINENGQFKNATTELAPDLKNIGMVTDAVWTDINQDGQKDLMLVGEWMPISIFINENGHLKPQKNTSLNHTAGLWNCIKKYDIDNDGDEDFILGNLGTNSRLEASPNQPLALYTGDFDQNGSFDPLIGQYYLNKAGGVDIYPLHSRDDVMKQLPILKKKYLKYEDFSQASFTKLLNTSLDAPELLLAQELKTILLKNNGNGDFTIENLPAEAQQAPIQDLLIDDFNQDGQTDILMVGNDYTAEKNNGWYDAFNGALLLGKSDGIFEAEKAGNSGFFVPGDARTIIKLIDYQGRSKILIGQNNGELLSFFLNKSANSLAQNGF